ncbi:MAG TPA: hypothetical protein DD417_14375 [Elusimicrobia bacterium]|nr:hypothetical protein [Elusimicrobiota bacterium]
MRSIPVSPAIMWTVVFCLALAAQALPPEQWLLSSRLPMPVFWTLLPFWSLWVLISAWVHRHQVVWSAQRVEHLVKAGPYSVIRHPIYVADIVLCVLLFLVTPTLRSLVVFGGAALVFLSWARLEDQVLRRRFGTEWALYADQVPAFIPRLSKLRHPTHEP